MDLFKKFFDSASLFPFVSDHTDSYINFIIEKPASSVLAPVTLVLFCYYVYAYVRKFYPISVNCWFCNADFKVAFEDRFEYICNYCGQFNGFKEDGSYCKTIPEQHDHRYNKTVFAVTQSDIKESKNGLCHKCNIIQEMKVKQLASFTPTKEKYFDREVEKFKENLEETLKLCNKCNSYMKKVLSIQQQRYNLKSTRINNLAGKQSVHDWPHVSSLCLSFISMLLLSSTENYFGNWATNFLNTSVFYYSFVTTTRLIGIISFSGILCQVYHCLSTMDKLSAVVMLLWSTLFAINNFEILENFKPRLLLSVFITLLSLVSVLKNMSSKHKIRQTSIQLEDENYKFQTSYKDFSSNGSVKNNDDTEMMEIDHIKVLPKSTKKTFHKTVNNMFQGMNINDHCSVKNNIIRPPKFTMLAKRDKLAGYADTLPGFYPTYPMKDDYDFDTQSIYSQHSYRSQCSPLCHQHVSPYNYYVPPVHNSPLNLSHSSNTSNIQHTSEWPKMLMYTIPGIVLLALQYYLLCDIKDFLKQK